MAVDRAHPLGTASRRVAMWYAPWCGALAVCAIVALPTRADEPVKVADSAATDNAAPDIATPETAAPGNAAPDSAPPAVSPDEAERFFESRVRPMLSAHCLACHGPEKQEAGLRLDSREALLKGSDSAPVVVPGDPEASPLIHAVRYDGDVQMPPDGKLDDAQQSVLVAWVKLGVPWAASASAAKPLDDLNSRIADARQSHWSLRPIRRPELPPVSDAAWSENPIDRFVFAALESQGLSPSPPADRRTLLRRVKFDLVGLPPTAAEVDEFLADESPEALARLVDRLLASPEYGQRWGRYWLDVARYSDTKGYVFTEDRRYPYSYTYRDYVIRAHNEDLPYDEFVRQQIAADQMDLADHRNLAAMGLLTLGRRFSNNIHDIIDDRIDVVTRGLMGLTVTCARCHDHKYDPVASDDYYALYGVFASSVEPGDLPLIGEPADDEAYQKFQAELEKRDRAYNEFREAKLRELTTELRARAKDYLCQVVIDTMQGSLPEITDFLFDPEDVRPPVVRRWKQYLARMADQRNPVFVPWHELAALPPEEFAAGAAAAIERWSAAEGEAAASVNPRVRAALAEAKPKSMLDVAQVYGDLLAAVDQSWNELARQAEGAGEAAPERLPEEADEQLRQVLYGQGAPPAVSLDEARRVFDRKTVQEFGNLRKAVDEWKVDSPAAPPRAMVLSDAAQPQEPRIFLRGDPARPGKAVSRRFVTLLQPAAAPFSRGSGRLELAQAIASPDNPLTPRVAVNRVWMHHFGAPLVRTPGDFGLRSEPPTHPELLDYLAATFIEQGWSLKKLHRAILLSRTYQQSSADRAECRDADPENRLLWRANRRRLDFESLRDSILAAAGRLDTALDGRPIDLWKAPFSTRRTVYAYIDRQDLPGIFRVFDFASPDVSTPQRPQTTVPQQLLFVMNAPFVIEQAQHLAARPEVQAADDLPGKVQAIYRACFARDADADELQLAAQFVDVAAGSSDDEKARSDAIVQYAQALLLANEFVFID